MHSPELSLPDDAAAKGSHCVAGPRQNGRGSQSEGSTDRLERLGKSPHKVSRFESAQIRNASNPAEPERYD